MSESILGFIRATGNEGHIRPEWMRVFPDDRYAMAKPLLFHWTILTGSLFDEVGYEDRWCFATQELALAALAAWPEDPPAGYEPEGWHRHPKSGRRREGADAAKEYFDS